MGVNETARLLESAARTATTNTDDQVNRHHRGIEAILDCTASAVTPSITFKIQGKDPISGEYYDILESAAITGDSTNTIRIYPGIAATANVAASRNLPAVWRIAVTHADADSITYSLAAHLLV